MRPTDRRPARLAAIAALLLALGAAAGPAAAQIPGLPDPPAELPGLPGGDGDPGEGDGEAGGGGGADPGPDGADPDDDQAPPPGSASPGGGGADIRTAYWTSPTSDSLPRTLIAEFPPGVVCILVPETCTEEADQLGGPIGEALGAAVDGVDAIGLEAPQPVPPGSLPVGILSGAQRYASALDIPLPPVGEDQSYGELTITLQMTPYAFSLESPAFRELVNAVLIQATPNSGPEPFQALVEAIAAGETDVATDDFPGLEMCVIKTPWEAGENQPSDTQPEIDPLACSDVARPGEDGRVTFDMTFAANDSLPDGLVPGWEGVLVRPLGSANLAFGDPDYSTNYIAYVEDPAVAAPALTSSVVDDPPPPPPVDGSPPASGPGSPSTGGGGSGSTGGGAGGTAGGSTGGAAGGAPSAGSPAGGAAADPAPGVTASASGTTSSGGGPPAGAPDAAPTSTVSSAWMTWVLLPALLGGALWYGRVLDARPGALVVRAGAMTRLLRQRGFPV